GGLERAERARQGMALLTRARAIEPWDPDPALDLARLYARTGMVDNALHLLASLAPRVRGRVLRRVRGLQWRSTLSFYHAWRWLEALWQELRGEPDSAAPPLPPPPPPPPPPPASPRPPPPPP